MGKAKKIKHVVIRVPKFLDIIRLPQLFLRAINEDYSFYNKAARKKILNRNSLFHLLTAKINSNRVILVCNTKDKDQVGVLLGALGPDGVGIVNWLYVIPEFRKNKIASNLLLRTEKEFKQKGCHKLTVSTEIAQKFYKKMGYTLEGKLKNHWWGEDFYIFSKFLK